MSTAARSKAVKLFRPPPGFRIPEIDLAWGRAPFSLCPSLVPKACCSTAEKPELPAVGLIYKIKRQCDVCGFPSAYGGQPGSTTPSSDIRPSRTRRAVMAPILRLCADAIAAIASPAWNAARSRSSSSALQESPCRTGAQRHCSCPSEPVACRAARRGDCVNVDRNVCSPCWATASPAALAVALQSDTAVHDRTIAAGVRLRRSPANRSRPNGVFPPRSTRKEIARGLMSARNAYSRT